MSTPEVSMFGKPIWCHHHCGKCRLESLDLNSKRLFIVASAASLTISFNPRAKTDRWVISWEIRHSRDESSHGTRVFSDADLASAFLSAKQVNNWSDWVTKRYGGDSALQGGFIRWQDYLNIPCPGTGHDGDPNISIEIDGKIRTAVQALLQSVQ